MRYQCISKSKRENRTKNPNRQASKLQIEAKKRSTKETSLHRQEINQFRSQNNKYEVNNTQSIDISIRSNRIESLQITNRIQKPAKSSSKTTS